MRAPFPLFALAAGVVLGVSGPLLRDSSGTAVHATHVVLSSGWAWAAFAFLTGLATRTTKKAAAVLAAASLVVAVVAYYLTQLAVGDDFQKADLSDPYGGATHTDWVSFFSMTAVWSTAACVLGSLLGLAGTLAKSSGFRGLPFQLLVPLVAFVDTSRNLRYVPPLQPAVVTSTWEAVRILAIAAAVVLVGFAAVSSWARTRVNPESVN